MRNVRFVLAFFLLSAVAAFAQGPFVDNDHLVQPSELAQLLQSKSPKPLILNIGPRMLYEQAHIAGAELIGPAADPRGLEALRARVKALPKNQAIVLYCGCCPWSHCPNVEPAYKQLKSLGFTNVKVLYIANNIGTDWVYKGYPTVKGQ
jgi:thiosulfate/3-mercaptopyruvate sulfurtransferase